MSEFSFALKSSRHAAGLTQQQAADLLGVSKSTYCNWEAGRNEPRYEPPLIQAEVLNIVEEKIKG